MSLKVKSTPDQILPDEYLEQIAEGLEDLQAWQEGMREKGIIFHAGDPDPRVIINKGMRE